MTAEERARIAAQLVRTIGEEATSALVAESARTDDLAAAVEHLAVETQAGFARVDDRFARVDQEMKAGFARVDDRFARIDDRLAALEARTDERFEDVRGWIDAARLDVLAAVRGELIEAVARQTRTMAFTLIGALAGLSGLAYTLARLP